MKVEKNILLCLLLFIINLFFAYYAFGSGKVGDYLVTLYDEIRYLENTDRLIVDLKAYGLFYVFDNYYAYSQSVHFGHYFVLAFIRYFFHDSMFFWTVYQLLIYSFGVFYFSKYMLLEYEFIKINQLKYISLMLFLYPVFHYLAFSLMRDISIFAFIAMALYFYKANKFFKMFLILLILSSYRINMTLCILVYVLFDQLKGKNILSILKYFFASIVVVVAIDSIAFGFIFRNLNRLNDLSLSNLINQILVFLFSPLPFTIDESLPEYLRSWLKLSFFICLLLATFYIVILVYSKFNKIVPVVPVMFMSLFYVFVYSTEFGIGFRQASMILPFIYIPLFFYLFDVFIRKNLNQEKDRL